MTGGGAAGRVAGAGLAGLLGWLATLALTGSAVFMGDITRLQYPRAPGDGTVDLYHGESVADPYRWLEDLGAAATQEWMSGQNRLTAQVIGRLPARARFAGRLRALLDFERIGVPQREAGVYAYPWNPGQAEQDALRVTDDPAKPGRVLVDPVAIRSDGTVSLGGWELSPDGSRLAYSLSDGGSDWRTWHVRATATGEDAPEVLEGTKFTGVSWTRDSRSFYYSRYPRNADGSHDDARQAAIWRHVVGTAQAADEPVFAIGDHPTREPYAQVTEDGRHLVITVQDGFETNGLYYTTLAEDGSRGPVVRLLDGWDARYEFLGADGNVFYVLTTRGAPRGRIVAINLSRPDPALWQEVVPESAQTIEEAALVGGRIVVQTIRDAHARVGIHDLQGHLTHHVTLPGQGTAGGFSGSLTDPEVFFAYTDFTTPRTVYRLDVHTGESHPVRVPRSGVDPTRYVTEQVFYRSRDGTRIPMHIVRRRDVLPDGARPTVLYGYGGFNVSLLPAYSASRMAWIEAGGIYVQANLRGGGEYGEAWHQAGTKQHKQNVFDDFIAAAEWLIANDWTSPRHLAIWGGSNGGLLVGAVTNQRPDLFAAAVPSVGVMDMLRYQTASLNARKWSSDYGLSDDPELFPVLRSYSPYHNIDGGRCYPAVLVQADANDDRVAAWHSYKYAAALQDAVRGGPCARPALIRIETRSGHGAGASISKIVDEYADQWAFVADALGLQIP